MITPVELGDALSRMLESARSEEDAAVVVQCDASRITLRAADGVEAVALPGTDLSPDDEIAMQILGWRHEGSHFTKSWHSATSTAAIADDVVRATTHGFECDSFELHLELRALSHARG